MIYNIKVINLRDLPLKGVCHCVDNKQLIYFTAIAEECSISKASEKLFVAQPYLSRQLRLMEEELGAKLVERTTRKFQLTEAGRMLLYRGRQILELSEATMKEIKELNAGTLGTLRIGCISSAVETILLKKLLTFHAKFENVDYEVHQDSSSEILEHIKHGIIEIGFVRSPVNLGLFNYILLPAEPMAGIADSRLGLRAGDSVSLSRLASVPLLLHRKFEEEITTAFRAKGFEPRILCRTDDTRPLLVLAESGIGAAVVPKDWTALASGEMLERFDVPELNIKSRIVIVWLKNRRLNAAARHFIHYLKTEYCGDAATVSYAEA